METLIKEIEGYAEARGIKPGTVLQNACGYGGTRWAEWKSGGQCTLKMSDKIRAYIKANPAKERAAQ